MRAGSVSGSVVVIMNDPETTVPALLFGAPFQQPNIVHRTRFLAPDPVIAIDFGPTVALWVGGLEEHRAREESTADEVHATTEVNVSRLLAEAGSETALWPALVEAVVRHHHLDAVRVDSAFPAGIADRLRSQGIEVTLDWSLYQRERRIKTKDEIASLAEVERIGLGGLATAMAMLQRTEISDGVLTLDGAALSGGDLVHAVEAYFLAHDCLTTDSICCGGPESSDPHKLTSPVLRAGLPIVLDLFPYHRYTRYWGDLTRTVVVGDPDPRVRAMWDAVKDAQQQALDMVAPGTDAHDIHVRCCEVFRERGYGSLTPPYNEISSNARFIHGTGHGVGLEIHEFPRVGDPKVVLEEGDVITIEPGLYDPAVGGIRIEDLVVVTADGYRNLTDYPKSLALDDQPVDEYIDAPLPV